MLVIFLVLPLLAGALGALFGPDAWYAALTKPAWNPPAWVFPPVWTALYLAMGVAAWLVWRERPRSRALALWGAQLALNAAWTPLFFGLHRLDLALADIALLWLLVAATMIAFWRIRPAAGALLVPYLAWTTFATALSAAIWRMNA